MRECKPKRHEWFSSERTIDYTGKDGTRKRFSYPEQTCTRCHECMIGGFELQQLFDLAKQENVMLIGDWLVAYVLLYGSVRLVPSLKHDLEQFKIYMDRKGVGLEWPSMFLADGRDFVKAISRDVSTLEELGKIEITRNVSGRSISATQKGRKDLSGKLQDVR
jgi:hypothetical protein